MKKGKLIFPILIVLALIAFFWDKIIAKFPLTMTSPNPVIPQGVTEVQTSIRTDNPLIGVNIPLPMPQTGGTLTVLPPARTSPWTSQGGEALPMYANPVYI